MGQKQKNIAMMGLIYLIILIAYNLFVFLFFRNFNTVFWFSYGFMMAAFMIHIACVFSIVKNVNVKTVFFGIPLLSFSVYFVCAELFCSLVFMLFRNVAGVKAAILIQALLLSLFIVIAIISVMARNAVQSTDDKIRDNVSFIKELMIDAEMLLQRSTDAEVTSALKKLSEAIKYSDPMANASVESQEQMIIRYMAELRDAFDASNGKKTKELCEKLELLFTERNKILMISK